MLDFKGWILEQINTVEKDPAVNMAMQKASLAMQAAVKKGIDPIKAAQNEIIKSKVPMHKMGKVMPIKDDGSQNAP